MIKGQKIKTAIGMLILMGISVSGCVPTRERGVEERKRTVAPAPAWPEERMEQRISFLRGLLREERLENGDRRLATDLLNLYEELHPEAVGKGPLENGREPILALLSNLMIMDEAYFSKKGERGKETGEVMTRYASRIKRIVEASLAEDHQSVVDDCTRLEADFGASALTPDIGLLLAFSLAHQGRIQDAVNVGSGVLKELEGRPGYFNLRVSMMDWFRELGDREMAQESREKLTDSLEEMKAVALRAERRLLEGEEEGGKERAPASDLAKELNLEQRPEDDLDKLFEKVERLLRSRSYDEAKLLLIRQRLKAEEGPDTEIIDQALKVIESSEETYRAEERKRLAKEKDTLDMARALIDEEEYEKALLMLEELDDDTEFRGEKEEVKRLAIEKLINRERNKAAKMFLKAKNTDDPSQRKGLLLASHNILKVLVEKYPSSHLIHKINNNIEIVNQELEKLEKAKE